MNIGGLTNEPFEMMLYVKMYRMSSMLALFDYIHQTAQDLRDEFRPLFQCTENTPQNSQVFINQRNH
jgi:hypothetical protein